MSNGEESAITITSGYVLAFIGVLVQTSGQILMAFMLGMVGAMGAIAGRYLVRKIKEKKRAWIQKRRNK